MSPEASWPVPITTVGPAAGGTAVWRCGGKLHVTAVIKATFALVPGGVMRPLPPEELFRTEMHHRDNPTRSLRATSDVVPYLPRVDVVFTGHACAPPGQAVTQQAVRLAVYHRHAILDKTLHVYGDRKGREVQPFHKVPILHERALGGIGFPGNPFGTGIQPGSAPPSVLYPGDASAVAGFGPLSRALPERKQLLGAVPRSALDQPIPDLPGDFDFSYFHAAPPDQRVDALVGNEWIVLEGLSPEYPRLSSRLPTVLGVASVFGLDPDDPDAAHPIALRPDIVRIDGDAQRCSVVLRRVIPLDDDRSLAVLRIVAGVEMEGHALAWPPAPPPRNSISAPAGGPAVMDDAADDLVPTIALGDSDGGYPETTTVRQEAPPPSRPSMPFVPAAGRPPAVHVAPVAPESPFAGTFSLTPEAAARAQQQSATPFAAAGRSAPATPEARPIPGAPWSGVPAAPAPTPAPGAVEQTRTVQFSLDLLTIDLDAPAPLQPPPEPEPVEPEPAPPPRSAPAVAPAPASAPEAPAKPAWSWATPPSEPKQEAPKPAPAPPRAPPRPAVNQSLYGDFSPKKKK